MSSQIRAIYQAVAALPLVVPQPGGNLVPPAYTLEAAPRQVEAAMLPCRVIMPYTPRGEGRDWSFIALGTLAKVTWRVSDMLLWRPIASGLGPEDVAGVLIDYVGHAADVLRQHRSLGLAQTHITGARYTYGTFFYPEQSDSAFLGVTIELDIEEVLSGCQTT